MQVYECPLLLPKFGSKMFPGAGEGTPEYIKCLFQMFDAIIDGRCPILFPDSESAQESSNCGGGSADISS